jgi:hypothetical protein
MPLYYHLSKKHYQLQKSCYHVADTQHAAPAGFAVPQIGRRHPIDVANGDELV